MVLQHSCVFQYLTWAWLSSNAQIRMPPILNFRWDVAGLEVSWQLLLPPESRAHCVKNFSPALLCHAQGYHICGFLHKHPLLASGTFVSVNFRIFLYIPELWQSSWSKPWPGCRDISLRILDELTVHIQMMCWMPPHKALDTVALNMPQSTHMYESSRK